ncbi:MAG: hypothetical protein ACK4MM_07535 [Fervidobacterium sp.]
MKAQLSIEYLVAFSLFISLIGYIYLQYTRNIPYFVEEVKKEDIRATAFQISELLINDYGEPENWDTLAIDQIKRIGLSDNVARQGNFISKNKIDRLKNECTQFSNIQKWTGFNKPFSILVFEINQNDGSRTPLITDCRSPQTVIEALNATVKRYAAYSDGDVKIAEIIIQV